jgi:single-strand DNA-binding protein
VQLHHRIADVHGADDAHAPGLRVRRQQLHAIADDDDGAPAAALVLVSRSSAFWTLSMAGSVNKVILIGNLGRDPEIRTTQDGTKIANFTVATSERWRDRGSGEMQERTEWHRVVIFNERLVDVAERFLKKGAKVYLEGSLQTRKWTDKDGQEKYTTEVVLSKFRGELTMLDGRREGGMGEEGGGFGGGQDFGGGGGRGSYSGGAGGGGSKRPPADLDDDIPF